MEFLKDLSSDEESVRELVSSEQRIARETIENDEGDVSLAAQAALSCKWAAKEAESSDSEHSDVGTNELEPYGVGEVGSEFESAETLLTVVKSAVPSFMKKPDLGSDLFYIEPVKSHSYSEQNERLEPKASKKSDDRKVSAPTLARDTGDKQGTQARANKHPALPSDRKHGLKDTESAKDKVKRQRLSGQSGIGSDFRTWRSDEEMRMRQQFD